MPGLVAFGRRWSIGSDDLLIPSLTLFITHILWLIIMVVSVIVDFFGGDSKWPKASCKLQSLGLMCSAFVLILLSTILEICLAILSLRGSILNDEPRSGVPYLLYVRLSALMLELLWSIVAVVWSQSHYFSCDLVLTKQTIIGLMIWVWVVCASILITAWCVYDVAGRSWVKMKRYQANVKEAEHRHPSFRRSGSTTRNWRQRKVMRQYESSWNNRCRFLFCCVHNSDSSRDSFGDLAKLLSEFFRDLDVVPSDIIAGLLLLRRLQRLEQVSIINEKRNNTYEFLSGIAITPHTKFVAMNDAHDLEAYHNVVYYMRYASAAYGWLWYVIPNGFRGLFNLCSNVKCCFHRYLCTTLGNEMSERVVEDNCCFCNVAVIPTMFDPTSFDIVYATYHVDVGETPFFVVVDYEKEAVVISIRGTLSLKDLMTDLNAEAEPLPLNPVRDDWLGHKGMVQAAAYLKSKLVDENILNKAFELCQARANKTFNIVIVGHSLGGGTAAILAILLREQFPDLKCFAYSPPGGLLSMPAVEYTKKFVTSVIVGKDLVPRIGLSQMEALRADLLNAIRKSHTPKWKTIMSGMKCCKCLRGSDFTPANDLSNPNDPECGSSTSYPSYQGSEGHSMNDDSILSMTMHQPLYPPGKIMHVVRHHPKKDEIKYESIWRRVVGKREPVFQAIWTENTDYDEVLISPGMIQDHMPDNVLKALSRVSTSLGPAKPQRSLTNNASPLNPSHESHSHSMAQLGGGGPGGLDFMETSSKEVSFVSEQYNPPPPHQMMMGSGSGGCGEPASPPPVLMNTKGKMMMMVNEIQQKSNGNGNGIEPTIKAITTNGNGYGSGDPDEPCDEYISLTGSPPDDTLFTLKVNWDVFKDLGMHPLKFQLNKAHSRNSSSGSSNSGSELGTTLREIFGPIKLYEGTVPLASSETLSEISSMSSKASFILRERSPMTKVKLCKNLSLRGNGEAMMMMNGNGNGKSHQRSFSCVYPDGRRSNSLTPKNIYGTLNGGMKWQERERSTNGNSNGNEGSQSHIPDDEFHDEDDENGTTNGSKLNGHYRHQHHRPSEANANLGGNNNGDEDGSNFDQEQTPTGAQPDYLEEAEFIAHEIIAEAQFRMMANEEREKGNVGGEGGDPQPYNRIEGQRDEQEMEDEDEIPQHFPTGITYYSVAKPEPETTREYSPVYPVFTEQEEYGREGHRSTHYTYSSQSPIFGSNTSVHHSREGTPEEPVPDPQQPRPTSPSENTTNTN